MKGYTLNEDALAEHLAHQPFLAVAKPPTAKRALEVARAQQRALGR